MKEKEGCCERLMAAVVLLVVGTVSSVGPIIVAGHGRPGLSFGCGERLERALDALQKDRGIRRVRIDEEEAFLTYQQELRSAPLEMIVSRINVKLPGDRNGIGDGEGQWARVEKCVFEPADDSLQTRVTFKDMSVSGSVSLYPRDIGYQDIGGSESCKMTLRLRRAGIDFVTIPISRRRGQMRISTESNFMEPRFASIYAYGCHPTRLDKQIKRQDKWPPRHVPLSHEDIPMTQVDTIEKYETAEPRISSHTYSNHSDLPISRNHSSVLIQSVNPDSVLWQKNVWITKSLERKRRWTTAYETSRRKGYFNVPPDATSVKDFRRIASKRNPRVRRSLQIITPEDFTRILLKKKCLIRVAESKKNMTHDCELKSNFKRENHHEIPRENRELNFDEKIKDTAIYSMIIEDAAKSWETKERLVREMEDVFLRGASQALTRYIERQLHPAIKETLLLSMGYTISYG